MDSVSIATGVLAGSLSTWFFAHLYFRKSLQPSVRLVDCHWQSVQTASGHIIPKLCARLRNCGGQLLKPHVWLTLPAPRAQDLAAEGATEPTYLACTLSGGNMPAGHVVSFHSNPPIDGFNFRQSYAEFLGAILAATDDQVGIVVEFGDFDSRLRVGSKRTSVRQALRHWIQENATLWARRDSWGLITKENDMLLPAAVCVVPVQSFADGDDERPPDEPRRETAEAQAFTHLVPSPEDVRTEYQCLSTYTCEVVKFRFTVLGLYLAAVALIAQSPPSVDRALLLIGITVGLYFIELRNRSLLTNLNERGMQIERHHWGYRGTSAYDPLFSHQLKTKPLDDAEAPPPPALDYPKIWKWRVRLPVSHTQAIDLTFAVVLVYAIYMLVRFCC